MQETPVTFGKEPTAAMRQLANVLKATWKEQLFDDGSYEITLETVQGVHCSTIVPPLHNPEHIAKWKEDQSRNFFKYRGIDVSGVQTR